MAPIIWYYLVGINALTFALYTLDKQRARRARWRISERRLLILAIIGGSLGSWLAMKLWRHKTRHRLFSLGIPLMLAVHLALLIYLSLRSH